MKFNRAIKTAVAAVLLMMQVPIQAQSGGDFEITRATIDAGGGRSQGGGFVLIGTIGQVDAVEMLSGGAYVLSGGFWASGGSEPLPESIFADGFET